MCYFSWKLELVSNFFWLIPTILWVVSMSVLFILLIFSTVFRFVFNSIANIFENALIKFFLPPSVSINSLKSSCTDSARLLKTSKALSVASLLLFSSLINYSISSVIFSRNFACASWSAFLIFFAQVIHCLLRFVFGHYSRNYVRFFIEIYVFNAIFGRVFCIERPLFWIGFLVL